MFKTWLNNFNRESFRNWMLTFAELIDAWRVSPRLLVYGYAAMTWEVIKWFMALHTPSTPQTALVTAVVGLATVVFSFYVNSGRKWTDGYTENSKLLQDMNNKVDALSVQVAKQTDSSDS